MKRDFEKLFGNDVPTCLMRQYKITVIIKALGPEEEVKDYPANYATINAADCPLGATSCVAIDKLHDAHNLCSYCCGFQIDTVFCRHNTE